MHSSQHVLEIESKVFACHCNQRQPLSITSNAVHFRLLMSMNAYERLKSTYLGRAGEVKR